MQIIHRGRFAGSSVLPAAYARADDLATTQCRTEIATKVGVTGRNVGRRVGCFLAARATHGVSRDKDPDVDDHVMFLQGMRNLLGVLAPEHHLEIAAELSTALRLVRVTAFQVPTPRRAKAAGPLSGWRAELMAPELSFSSVLAR